MNRADPPLWIHRFFYWFCDQSQLEGLEGDLYELFDRRVAASGVFLARWMCFFDVISLLRSTVVAPAFKNSKFHKMGLYKNYFRTALRVGIKQKSFSFINLLGLTLGITSVLFIALYVTDELGYDAHITKPSLKYRMYNEVVKAEGPTGYFPIVPPMFAPSIAENFPHVERIGRVFFDYGGTVFYIDDKVFSEKNGVYAEITAMEILDLNLIHGDFASLSEPKTMLLSRSTFQKFFGDVPFQNQTVKLTRSTVKIVGIYEDFPRQSHLKLDYIFSFDWLKSVIPEKRMKAWRWQQFFTYVELKKNADFLTFDSEVKEYIGDISHEFTAEFGFSYTPYFQPIRDVHLHSENFQWEIAEVGSYDSILFLSIAAGFILFIACLNFINLTTAQAIRRGREVGIRKFVGATRGQLLIQYNIEAFVYCLIAGMASLLLVVIGLEGFNQFTGKSFTLGSIFTLTHLAIFFMGIVVLALISGWYPSLMITRFKPISVLHGSGTVSISVARKNLRVESRHWLVGIQYVLSIGLILISLVVSDQFRFLREVDMGFDKDNLMYTRLTSSMENDLEATKSAFSSHPDIQNISFSYGIPGGIVAGDGAFFPEVQDLEFSANMFIVEANYINTMMMDIVAGRDFSPDLESDVNEGFIINETAVRSLGFASPEEALGTRVRWKMWVTQDTFKVGRVIGVISDFNFKSLHHQIESVIMHQFPPELSFMLVRFRKNEVQDAMAFIESKFREFEPARPFEYKFVDQSFASFYESEQKMGDLFTLFTFLAILTASIGLYGLVSYSVVSRSKEISIRKVLGAGASTIFRLLVSRYVLLTLVCVIIAVPVAYYLMAGWLNNFAYHVDISFLTFVLVVVITIGMTFLTVGYQAWAGARSNPAEKLRTE